MTQELNLRLKTIQHHLNKLNDGYSKVHVLSIKNEAEGVLRVCLKELGGNENNLPKFQNPPPPPEPPVSKLKCRFCNLEFDTERGILAHESVIHREVWKQAK